MNYKLFRQFDDNFKKFFFLSFQEPKPEPSSRKTGRLWNSGEGSIRGEWLSGAINCAPCTQSLLHKNWVCHSWNGCNSLSFAYILYSISGPEIKLLFRCICTKCCGAGAAYFWPEPEQLQRGGSVSTYRKSNKNGQLLNLIELFCYWT